MKKKKIILIAVSLAILAGGGVWLFGGSTAKHKVTYATATVSKGASSFIFIFNTFPGMTFTSCAE